MIETFTISVTVAGSAGSATGSGRSMAPANGKVVAVHLDYTTQPATTDVTVASEGPAQTLLTITNANTDAWFYPRQLMDGTNGADLTGVYDALPVAGYLTVAVAQGDPGSVVATILVEC